MHQPLISPVLFHQPLKKGGKEESVTLPIMPTGSTLFPDHGPQQCFSLPFCGASQNPSTTQSVNSIKRHKLLFFRRSHVMINSNWFSEYHPCFPIEIKIMKTVYLNLINLFLILSIFLSVISKGKCIQCFGIPETHVPVAVLSVISVTWWLARVFRDHRRMGRGPAGSRQTFDGGAWEGLGIRLGCQRKCDSSQESNRKKERLGYGIIKA